MWLGEHTIVFSFAILVSIEHLLKIAMKNVCTTSLVVIVVALATVRSYVSLALHTRILPQHSA